jgi:hypothetical protein
MIGAVLQPLGPDGAAAAIGWGYIAANVRNFPCQTLEIRKVSLVVMGS